MKKYLFVCLCFMIGFCSCSSSSNKSVRIAILTPISHPSLQQIQEGFIEKLKEENPDTYSFDVYNAQGNKTLMRSEIEEIMRRDYDLIFTIGTLSSQMTVEVLSKKGRSTPVVFTCVNDPVGFHIVQSEECSGNMATGIKELLDFEEELSLLLQYKPSIETLLLVYNPTEPGLEKDQKQLLRLTQERGIKLVTVEIFHTNELIAKVPPFMGQADAVLVLKDNSVVSGLDALVKLCNQYKIPLMASDLDSPDKGAALGFGVHEKDFGKEAAKKALLILNDGLTPSSIPVTPLDRFSLKINQKALIEQGGSDASIHP